MSIGKIDTSGLPPDALQRVVRLVLPDERPPSWNTFYGGTHWSRRRDEVERVRMAVRAAIDPEVVQPFAVPVDIEIAAYFAVKSLDADNIPAKLYIDALKGWIIADDDRRYVRSVSTRAEADAGRPRVEIEVRAAVETFNFVDLDWCDD